MTVRVSPSSPCQWNATLSPRAGLDVAVQTVVGDVQLAADEPLVERRVGVVEYLVPLLEPVQALAPGAPTSPASRLGLLVDRRVAQERVLLEVLRRLEPLDIQQRRELLLEFELAVLLIDALIWGHPFFSFSHSSH